jgi:rRNA processing protein Gar1
MRKLGRVVSLSGDKLVLKTDKLVKIGAKIFDEQGKFVGNAIDYFGPTMGPYILVSPKRDAGEYVGKELFG